MTVTPHDVGKVLTNLGNTGNVAYTFETAANFRPAAMTNSAGALTDEGLPQCSVTKSRRFVTSNSRYEAGSMMRSLFAQLFLVGVAPLAAYA